MPAQRAPRRPRVLDPRRDQGVRRAGLVHVLPDPDEPLVHVFAEATNAPTRQARRRAAAPDRADRAGRRSSGANARKPQAEADFSRRLLLQSDGPSDYRTKGRGRLPRPHRSDRPGASLLLQLEQDEEDVPRRRRLHGRIDLLRAEQTTRLRDKVAAGEAVVPDDETLAQAVVGLGRLPDTVPELGATRSRRCRISSSLPTMSHGHPRASSSSRTRHRCTAACCTGRSTSSRSAPALPSVGEGEEASHVQVDRLRDILAGRTSSGAAPGVA